jgi:hypothetical protein
MLNVGDVVVVSFFMRMLRWCGACALPQAVRFQYGEAVVFCAAMGIILGLPRYSFHIPLAPLPDTYLAKCLCIVAFCIAMTAHCPILPVEAVCSLHCVK